MFLTYGYNSIPRSWARIIIRSEPINMNWISTTPRASHTAAITDLRNDMFVPEVCICFGTSDQTKPNGQSRLEKIT